LTLISVVAHLGVGGTILPDQTFERGKFSRCQLNYNASGGGSSDAIHRFFA
jgi:hypothetical protein